MDRAHADRQREEDLAGGGEPYGGIGERFELWLPHEVQAFKWAGNRFGVGEQPARAVRAHRRNQQSADRQDNAEQDQHWHTHFAYQLDATGQAAGEDENIKQHTAEEYQNPP